MLREIITPEKSLVTVRLPDEMVGKTIEVIAFEIDAINTDNENLTREQRLKRIEEITAPTLTDLSNFKFNRDEANDYDG
jgi:hypothetical protein